MSDRPELNAVDTVNIEEIMQSIRAQILAQKGARSPKEVFTVQVEGKKLPGEFYEHLYQAGLAYDQIHTQVYVSKSNTPIVGPIIQFMRRKIHELVVYYVNQVAANQIRVNTHLLHALNVLGQELEKEEE